ncbi:MAG: hypothetical protein WD066_10000 [Planctomycetaceae bacterium]
MSDDDRAIRPTCRAVSARERPFLAAFAIAAIAGLSVASALLMEHAAWGAFAAIGLLLATWRFFVPRVDRRTDCQPVREKQDRRTDCQSVRRDEGDAASAVGRIGNPWVKPQARRIPIRPADSISKEGLPIRLTTSPTSDSAPGSHGLDLDAAIGTDRRSALRHAFAVDPPGPAEPTDEERPIVEALVREIARRRMTVPAIAFLEMSRPLNYVASQTFTFFGPLLAAITDSRGPAHLAAFLERRGSIDWLLERLEKDEGANVEIRSPSGE